MKLNSMHLWCTISSVLKKVMHMHPIPPCSLIHKVNKIKPTSLHGASTMQRCTKSIWFVLHGASLHLRCNISPYVTKKPSLLHQRFCCLCNIRAYVAILSLQLIPLRGNCTERRCKGESETVCTLHYGVVMHHVTQKVDANAPSE